MAPPLKKVKYECKFQEKFTRQYNFILSSKKGESHAYCRVCDSDFTVHRGGMNDVANHLQTRGHKKNFEAQTSSVTMDSFFKKDKKEDEIRRKVISAELQFNQFIVEHNLPFTVADHAGKLFQAMFPDSEIAKKYASASTKATALSHCLAVDQTTNLVAKLQKHPFSIATDGSNDKGASQLYPIVVRYFDEEKEQVVTELLKIVDCVGDSTGENIFKLLDQELERFSIPWCNAVAFSCDNASVMLGVHKGVAAFIQTKQPGIIISNCCCHLLHLAAKAGASQSHVVIQDILVDVYFYLDKSSKRQKALIQFQKDCGAAIHKILKYGATRWLSMQECICRMLEQWEPLREFFTAEKTSIKESHLSSDKYSKLRRICTFFDAPKSKLYCLFFKEILPVYTTRSLTLQRDLPQIHILQQSLHDLFSDLFARFVSCKAIAEASSVFDVKFTDRKNQMRRNDIIIGSDTKALLSKLRQEEALSSEEEDIFFSDVRAFFSKSVTYILNKFPLESEVLKNAQVLSVPDKMKTNFTMVKFFADRMTSVISPDDATSLEVEFNRYKAEKFDFYLDPENVCQQWTAIQKLKSFDGSPKYPLLPKLMKAIMCVPHSNADSERVFSIVKRNHTDFRASMSTSTLSDLLVQKMHMLAQGQQCYSVHFDEATLKKAKSATVASLKGSTN